MICLFLFNIYNALFRNCHSFMRFWACPGLFFDLFLFTYDKSVKSGQHTGQNKEYHQDRTQCTGGNGRAHQNTLNDQKRQEVNAVALNAYHRDQ